MTIPFSTWRKSATGFFSRFILPWLVILLCAILLPSIILFAVTFVFDLFRDPTAATEPGATLIDLPLTISYAIATPLAVVFYSGFHGLRVGALGMRRRKALRWWAAGLLLGFLFLALIFGVAWVTGAISPKVVATPAVIPGFLLAIVFFAIQGFTEEVAIRGYLFPALAAGMPVWAAGLLSTLVFTLMHAGNPNMTVMGYVNLFVFGLVFTFIYWRTGTLWFGAGIHSAWNFALGYLIGSHVSGIPTKDTLMSSPPNPGHDLFSGGIYGMEGAATVSILGLIVIAVCLLTGKKRLGRAATDPVEKNLIRPKKDSPQPRVVGVVGAQTNPAITAPLPGNDSPRNL